MTPEQRMISRLCGCLQITLRKYKVAGITGTASLLDEARAMVPETTPCPVCSHIDTIDNGTACAFCGCDLPNAQTEPCGCLARKVPSRSEEKALSVTSNRIGSSAWLGSFLFCLDIPGLESFVPVKVLVQNQKSIFRFHSFLIFKLKKFG